MNINEYDFIDDDSEESISHDEPIENKPWLNENGALRSDQEIQESCKDWSMEQWESYLSDTEPAQRETSVFSPEVMNNYSAEEYANAVFTMASEERFALLKTALRASILELTHKQQAVLNLYYWEGLPVAEIARKMKVHRRTVERTLEAAIEKLRKKIVNGAIHRKIRICKELAS